MWRCDCVQVTNPYRTILKPAYRPQLFVACTATLFQQWTGINTVIFYSPQLFVSLGTGQSAALIATIITGIVNHFATYVSLWAADEFGRRLLFLEAGVQVMIPALRAMCNAIIIYLVYDIPLRSSSNGQCSMHSFMWDVPVACPLPWCTAEQRHLKK